MKFKSCLPRPSKKYAANCFSKDINDVSKFEQQKSQSGCFKSRSHAADLFFLQ